LGSGALIAAVGLGVVATYRGSGVVNFATGAIAMYIAYVYTYLRTDGTLFLPPLPNPLIIGEGLALVFGASWHAPAIPTTIQLGGPMAFWPATLVSLSLAAALGLVLHLLVFRPLRSAPPLAKVVASVGVLLILQAIVVLRFGANVGPEVHDEVLPGGTFGLFGTSVPWDRIALAVIVIIATVALWALYKFTRFGLATRAAAESEKGAVLVGISPDFQAGANWMLACVLAGFVGILLRGILPLESTLLTLAIVPALAAALLGGFTSFGITTAAALGIGMLQSLVTYLETQSWWPRSGDGTPIPGIREALPFVLIVVAMFLRGRSLPVRGAVGSGRLPFVPLPTRVLPGLSVVTALVGAALVTLDFGWRGAITNSLTAAVLVLSLVVLTGFLGQISLMQVALAGVGGFALSRIAGDLGISFPIAPLLAALVATAFGLVAAIPALRVRGVNLAVVTLAAALVLETLVFNNDDLSRVGSCAQVSAPSFLGFRFGPNDSFFFGGQKVPTAGFGLFALVVAVLLCLLVVNLRRSSTGRHMLAVRSNERAAAAAGVSVAYTKMLAFGIAAFIAGLGGSLIGYKFGVLTAGTFGVFAGLVLLAFAYLGGITSVGGAALGGLLATGGVFFYAGDQWLGIDADYAALVGGIGLVLTAVLNPDGIAGGLRTGWQDAQRRWARHRAETPAVQGST